MKRIKLLCLICCLVHSASAIITMQIEGGDCIQYNSLDECIHAAQMVPSFKTIIIENEVVPSDKMSLLQALENIKVSVRNGNSSSSFESRSTYSHQSSHSSSFNFFGIPF